MFKIALVFGTRPEAIKMAPVVKELDRHPDLIKYRICLTAQHREMVDQVLDHFEIVPDLDLDSMRPEQNLCDITARLLPRVHEFLADLRPDYLIVHGDTATTLVAALAAFYLKIPVAHVEAGLRTGNRFSPFPEEINRKLTDCLSDLYFAPTAASKANLLAEGVAWDRIHVTGNTAVDALYMALAQNGKHRPRFSFPAGRHGILVTAHRRESLGKRLDAVCRAVRSLATARDDVHFVYPVHPNPEVRRSVDRLLAGVPNVTLTAPLDYGAFVKVMQESYLILTDSGGVQEEAPCLGKPVLVLRDCSERPEGVALGAVALVGTSEAEITAGVHKLLEDEEVYAQMARPISVYGDGRAAKRIVAALLRNLGCARSPYVDIEDFVGEAS